MTISTMHASGPDKEVRSFTLALLLHRWDAECKPRLTACMHKRFEQARVEDAVSRGVHKKVEFQEE